MSDNSGFSEEERHNIIISTLKEFNKGPDAFHERWSPDSGHLLTGDILSATPMFWYMKYKWTRSEIESLFFKARIVIDGKFDIALQQTFGGDPGPRWRGGGGVRKKVWRHADDVTMDHDIRDKKEQKAPRENDDMPYGIKHPDFEYNPVHQPVDFKPNSDFDYNPVVQPVDFQATGGVDKNNNDPAQRQYGKPPWDPLKKRPSDEDNPRGPIMGNGKIPSDVRNGDAVKLKPVPDGADHVNIECPDGELLRLDVNFDDPLSKIKRLIDEKTDGKYPVNEQILSHRNNALTGDKKLKDYGLRNRDTLVLNPINYEWEFGPLKPYELQMPPKGPEKKYKVDPLEPVDYRIKQEQGLEIGGFEEMPNL